jgi:hypothetical protein
LQHHYLDDNDPNEATINTQQSSHQTV